MLGYTFGTSDLFFGISLGSISAYFSIPQSSSFIAEERHKQIPSTCRRVTDPICRVTKTLLTAARAACSFTSARRSLHRCLLYSRLYCTDQINGGFNPWCKVAFLNWGSVPQVPSNVSKCCLLHWPIKILAFPTLRNGHAYCVGQRWENNAWNICVVLLAAGSPQTVQLSHPLSGLQIENQRTTTKRASRIQLLATICSLEAYSQCTVSRANLVCARLPFTVGLKAYWL